MNKVYTEEQMIQAYELGRGLTHEEVMEQFVPIQLPTDDEIKEEVSKLKFSKEGYRGGVIEGMIWMRDKIKGGQGE